MNTTSRLRNVCNEFEKDFLSSEYIVRNIDQNDNYKIEEIEEIREVNLRGKKNSIKVFGIE